MAHKWEDLLPYYAAGTLDAVQRARLSEHLETCEPCRRALREWEMISGAVRSEVIGWTQVVPPLRIKPLPGAAGGQSAGAAHYARRSASVTLDARWVAVGVGGSLAAGLLVFVLAGILLFNTPQWFNSAASLSSTTPTSVTLTVQGTLTAPVTSTVPSTTIARTPPPTLSPTNTLTPPAPLPTPTQRPIIYPTQPSANLNGATATALPVPIGGCWLRARDGLEAYVYVQPSYGSPQMDVIDQLGWWAVITTDGLGWYEIYNDGNVGWLYIDDIVLEGGNDCIMLPPPSPTMALSTPTSAPLLVFNVSPARCDSATVYITTGVPAQGVRVQVTMADNLSNVIGDVSTQISSMEPNVSINVTVPYNAIQPEGTRLIFTVGEIDASGQYLRPATLSNYTCVGDAAATP